MMTARRADDCRFLDEGGFRLDAWNRVSIPLRCLLGSGGRVSRVCFEDRSGSGPAEFWVDNVRLAGAKRSVPAKKTKRDGSSAQDQK